MRTLFTQSWQLAARGAARYGGRPSLYFRCALRLVLASLRNKLRRVVRKVVDTVRRTLYVTQALLEAVAKLVIEVDIDNSAFAGGYNEIKRILTKSGYDALE